MFKELERVVLSIPCGFKFSLDINEIAGIDDGAAPTYSFGGLPENTYTRVFLKSGKELLFKIPYSELKEIVDGAREDEKLSKS